MLSQDLAKLGEIISLLTFENNYFPSMYHWQNTSLEQRTLEIGDKMQLSGKIY